MAVNSIQSNQSVTTEAIREINPQNHCPKISHNQNATMLAMLFRLLPCMETANNDSSYRRNDDQERFCDCRRCVVLRIQWVKSTKEDTQNHF